MSSSEKILIVGIDSQIGSALKDYLIDKKIQVYGTTRKINRLNENVFYFDLENPSFELFTMHFTFMVICAANTNIEECESNPLKCKTINVDNTIDLIDKSNINVDFILYLSSSAVFDGRRQFYNPSDEPFPTNLYGKFKTQVENYLIANFKDKSCILRLTKVISKNTPFIERWMNELREGKDIVAFTNKFISPVDIADVVKSIYLLILEKVPGIFHFGGIEEISYSEYARRFFKNCPAALKLITDQRAPIPVNEIVHTSLTTSLPRNNCKISYSFEGTDLIVASLLRNVTNGKYIDVGANHPEIQNNTKYFYDLGWNGLAIDGNEEFEFLWQERRPRDIFVTSLISDVVKQVEFSIYPDRTISSIDSITKERYASRFAPDSVINKIYSTDTLYSLKDNYFGESEIHFLSIDVEGEDLNCLLGANLEKWQPGVIAIEVKILSLHDISSNPIVQFLSGYGYSMIGKTPLDAIFVHPNKFYLNWIPKELF